MCARDSVDSRRSVVPKIVVLIVGEGRSPMGEIGEQEQSAGDPFIPGALAEEIVALLSVAFAVQECVSPFLIV